MPIVKTRVISLVIQIIVFLVLLQGCTSDVIQLDIEPITLDKPTEKLNLKIVFVYADDLEKFSYQYKIDAVVDPERQFIDKILYADGEKKLYRYSGRVADFGFFPKSVSAGNVLRRNSETVFRNVFDDATTLYIPGEDHFTGMILDRQKYKEMVPTGTAGIIKLRSPEVKSFYDCKKPGIDPRQCVYTTELVAEWVLEDLNGDTIWRMEIAGSASSAYGQSISLEKLAHNSFQLAADDHFRKLVRALERAPEIRLFESCMQIDLDRLLANPTSVHETLNSIQNIQERRQIANKLVYLAIEKGNVALLNELFSTSYTDINQADKYYQRLPIHLAVQKNNFEIVELLITNGSPVNTTDQKGFTPLHYAASNGYTEITGLLIHKGANVNANNPDGQTPFFLAVTNGHQDVWQLLLDGGAIYDTMNHDDFLGAADLYNKIGLYFGAKNDKSNSAKALEIASGYFDKASQFYNRVAKKAETEAFIKGVFDFTLLTVAAWGSQWQAQQNAKQYAELKALNDASAMGLSQTQTLSLIHDYKANATSTPIGTPTPNNMSRTVSLESIADYYSRLSEMCRNSSKEVQSILKCYEERGRNYKECVPDEISSSIKSNQNSRLITASKDGNARVVRYLLSDNPTVNARDENGATALVWAATKGHMEVVKLLLEKGADINAKDSGGRTALWDASHSGYSEIVKLLLEEGADVNTKNNPGETALWTASWKGHTDIVNLLLESDADVNLAQIKTGITPLWIASQEGHLDIVKLLLENGASVNTKRITDGITALWMPSQNGHSDIVRLLLEHGAEVNIKDTDTGVTELRIASSQGQLEVVKLLLENGADIDIKDSDGKTPLWSASHNGYSEIVKLLLQEGADVNTKNNYGETALWIASSKGHLEVVKLLLERGAHVNIKRTSDSVTALWMASQEGHTEIVKLLLEKGVAVNIKDTDTGITELWIASSKGHLEVVKLLLENGTDVSTTNNAGLSPLDAAKEKDYSEIVNLLRKHGAR